MIVDAVEKSRSQQKSVSHTIVIITRTRERTFGPIRNSSAESPTPFAGMSRMAPHGTPLLWSGLCLGL